MPGNETGAFFKEAGLKDVSLVPFDVIQESAGLLHELGTAFHSAGKFKYYVRWIKLAGRDWQLAADIFPIDEPGPVWVRSERQRKAE